MDNDFKEDIELDANIVYQTLSGGLEQLVLWAFNNGDKFQAPSDAVKRAEWLKKQPTEYTKKVADRVTEMQNKQI